MPATAEASQTVDPVRGMMVTAGDAWLIAIDPKAGRV